MSMKYKDLMEITDEELIKYYDDAANHTVVGLNYYKEELERRRMEKSNNLMIRLTKWIATMTAVMLLSTAINIIIVFIR